MGLAAGGAEAGMMRIPAIRVRQWLDAWDGFPYDPGERQRKPEPDFYLCSIDARLLRRLSGVRRREATGPRGDDIGIQRGHEKDRSEEIRRFVEAGYPWAELRTDDKQKFPNLRKPGWLPTAIVANLVSADTKREGFKAEPDDLVTISTGDDGSVHLALPKGSENHDWERTGKLDPIEIIDGQHRLYAFSDGSEFEEGFELPVVLFRDLDISWQAYLFWTINITPKRINPSLAYDLYPLLRTADWLERAEGPMAYRLTRAQELTEALWGHPDSPWRERIGMLGRERGKVTQAAFVRSLTLSFVRSWEGPARTGIGGFFGVQQSNDRTDVLVWTRPQQAAYLLALWSDLAVAIKESDEAWAKDLRDRTQDADVPQGQDSAFAGRYSILATDQGVRGFLQVCNDLSYHLRKKIGVRKWRRSEMAEATDHEAVSIALADLRRQKSIHSFSMQLAGDAARFDWRSAVTPGLSEGDEDRQSRYRGGSGYKQVRLQLLRHLAGSGHPDIAEAATAVSKALGYDKDSPA